MTTISELDSEDVVLLILQSNERLLGSTAFRGVTRLEKLAYLVTQLSKADDLESTFDFRPYKYGPFSAKLYDAVNFLESINLLTTSRRPNVSPFAAAEEAEMLGDSDEPQGNIGHVEFLNQRQRRLLSKRPTCNKQTDGRLPGKANHPRLGQIAANIAFFGECLQRRVRIRLVPPPNFSGGPIRS